MKLISPVSLKTFEHNYTVISFSNCEIASLYNYEWIFDTKNNTINSKECVVVPLDGKENSIVGKTYADKYTKINFLDCGIAVGTSKDMLLVKYDPINDFICVENTILTVDNNKIPSDYKNPIYKDFDLKNDVNFSRTLSLKGSRMHGDDVVQL